MHRYLIIKSGLTIKVHKDYNGYNEFNRCDFSCVGLEFNVRNCRFVCDAESIYDALLFFQSEIERRSNIPRIELIKGTEWTEYDCQGNPIR